MLRRTLSMMRTWLPLLLCLALSGCGFHFRGATKLPFSSVHVAATEYTSFASDLKRYLSSGNRAKVVDQREQAEVVLEVLSESTNKQILSLSAAGKVREFELHYTVRFRLSDQQQREWIALAEIELHRDFTFDDTSVLAKEAEEGNLLRDMKRDALRLILRRLEKAKVPASS